MITQVRTLAAQGGHVLYGGHTRLRLRELPCKRVAAGLQQRKRCRSSIPVTSRKLLFKVSACKPTALDDTLAAASFVQGMPQEAGFSQAFEEPL